MDGLARNAAGNAARHGRRQGRAATVAWKQPPSPPSSSASSSSSSSPSPASSTPSPSPPASASPPPPTAAPPSTPPLRTLYPASAHHAEGFVRVSAIHSLYYRVYGNQAGKPALFLHGGPGAGCWPNHARFFDPAVYRIVLCDQRGAGKSTPAGCLEENTTDLLVADIEALREHLSVDRWALVMGGSWGTTLALAYAQAHPGRVAAMLLRGVCLLRRREIDWFYRPGGAEALFPFAWRDLMAALHPSQPQQTADSPAAAAHTRADGDGGGHGDVNGDLVAAFYERLTSTDAALRDSAARAWMRWEMSLSHFPTPSAPAALLAWDGSTYSFPPSPLSPPPPSSPPSAPSSPSSSPSSSPPSSPSSSSPTSSSSSSSPSSPSPPNSLPAAAPPAPAAAQASAKAVAAAAGEGSTGDTAEAEEGGTSEDGEQRRGTRDTRGRDLMGGPHISGSVAQARIECHYFHHDGFLSDNQLLHNIDAIRHIPTVIVHGRYDFVCPLVNAIDLHTAWLEAHLRVVPNAGHSMYEPGITHELIEASDFFRNV
ncbi:hypothetical protein CLOM_g19294 [Closterium sp. NIES-68]|nr:hypothetical protein CLOM_g19294 [Closterium sp. NIES-68]GJP58916.1 hypothetical protein CLOP_g6687 [Closterium sp. NIES-67]